VHDLSDIKAAYIHLGTAGKNGPATASSRRERSPRPATAEHKTGEIRGQLK